MGTGCSKKDSNVEGLAQSKDKSSKRKSSVSRKGSATPAPNNASPTDVSSSPPHHPPLPPPPPSTQTEPATQPESSSTPQPHTDPPANHSPTHEETLIEPMQQTAEDDEPQGQNEPPQNAPASPTAVQMPGAIPSPSAKKDPTRKPSVPSAETSQHSDPHLSSQHIEPQTQKQPESRDLGDVNSAKAEDLARDGAQISTTPPSSVDPPALPSALEPSSPAKPPMMIPEHADVELVKCILCERSFAADRIEKHKKICTGNENARAVFDVAKKRNEDTSTEIVVYVKHEDGEEKDIKLEKASIADLVTQIKEAFPQTSEDVYLYLRLPTRQTPVTNDNQLFYGAKIISSNSVMTQAQTFGAKKTTAPLAPVSRPSSLAPLPPLGKPGKAAPLQIESPDPSKKAKKKTPEASERIRQAKAEAARQRRAAAKAKEKAAAEADAGADNGAEDKWNMEVMLPTGAKSRRQVDMDEKEPTE
eukprot:TRINITY_DN1064_c0_g1_i1.p1 TRINITY_DN1064_c0_g1~~TRINITY_DN1064_c0_g1_i1.p1  ORF type:complete len:474 (+),score=127.55 TRINITY_DN1064_c0_g1_i1:158-1579(+)